MQKAKTAGKNALFYAKHQKIYSKYPGSKIPLILQETYKIAYKTSYKISCQDSCQDSSKILQDKQTP